MIGYKLLLVISLALLLGLLPIFLFSKPASGVNLTSGEFTQERLVGGLTRPTAMQFAPDGKLFVTEQAGTMQVVDTDGTLQSTPFLDISSKVDRRGERGLLGVAFDPDFDLSTPETTDYVYVYYTTFDTYFHNRVSRFPASLDNGNVVADIENEDPIFELPPLSEAQNHNGGAIHFGEGAGEEDKLYVAVGENARPLAAQSLYTTLGKMLRINKDGSIPTDNPFIDYTTGQNQAIWARGLRNPYSFDVQPDTGRIFINDVGQKLWEEINDGVPGANYGWPVYEGPYRYAPVRKKKGKRRHKKRRGYYGYPLLYAYTHGSGCAITGGAFYNPPSDANSPFPDDYLGDYFFADFCGGWIARYDIATDTATSFASGAGEFPVDLKEGSEGDLFFLARATGSVEKISYAP
ncbi:MAG: PQQ-dependent sugar dehydrogenase [Actinobacteria bacterium]|nr:PQQ-dependent sugar dehydrogenase [Actinomycetota bacterium]